MNNMLHIVIIVLAIQVIALCVAMAFGRAAKSGDRFEGPDEFDDARAAKTTLLARRKAARVAQPAQVQQSSH
ncbi:MLO family protein [Mycetohabitans sp. B8]|uniref:MLO family protein n=1 Tax=Mycetohabitans sp. B8 TaxID=2841845 RepID=UPI001F1990E0|nr:MLO family protein [Mycetohabitans sp. B8]MCG1042551.1 MLO family protein [Mycetohabitans sp. B8]